MTTYKRVSARIGNQVDLDVSFYKNGVLADPYAIKKVEIYKSQVLPHNLVATFQVVDSVDPLYPAPVDRVYTATAAGECGTEPITSEEAVVGRYTLAFDVPPDFTPDVYIDVWYYHPENPCTDEGSDGTDCDPDSDEFDDQLVTCCHRFWVYPNGWSCDDGLQSINFAFEPLGLKFNSPETRPLEVGLMPLPVYDYNFNLVNPIIPMLRGYIMIETQHRELIVNWTEMSVGLRQGSFRTNPWVMRYMLDTTDFLRGTYQYQVKIEMPDGSTRVSSRFYFTVQ